MASDGISLRVMSDRLLQCALIQLLGAEEESKLWLVLFFKKKKVVNKPWTGKRRPVSDIDKFVFFYFQKCPVNYTLLQWRKQP